MEPKSLTIGESNDGISIEYVKSRKVLRFSHYWDKYVGSESTEIPFKEFCSKLGIDLLKFTKKNKK